MTDEPIKVLMVEDDFQIAGLVQAILQRAQTPAFEVEHVTALAAALEKLKGNGFNVILADLTLPDSDGLDTFMALNRAVPDLPTVVLTGHEDAALEAKIIEAGAQDYLVKGHLNLHVLGKTLRCAVQRQRLQQAKLGRIIGFIGAKGGVGTTTVAINVAHALARQKKNVIAAELQPYLGTFSLEFGQEPSQDLSGLLELSSTKISTEELRKRLFNLPSGLRVLFSPQRVVDFKEILAEQAEAILEGLAHMADYTIVDLPSHPSGACVAAVRTCNFICLVLEREPTSVMIAKRALEHLKSYGASGTLVGAVIVGHVALDMPLDLREISTQLPCRILGVIPPAAEALNHARRIGTPLVLASPENPASVALMEIAGRLTAETITGLRF